MVKRWENVKNKTAKDLAVIDEVLPLARKFREATDEFSDWLIPAEQKLENFENLVGDQSAIARQQEIATELREGVLRQKSKFEELEDSGKGVTDVAKKDQDVVRKEFDEVAGRWEKLQVDLAELSSQLSEVQKLLEEFNKRLGPIAKLVEQGEEVLKSVGPLGIDVERNKEEIDKIKVRDVIYTCVFQMKRSVYYYDTRAQLKALSLSIFYKSFYF